MRQALQALIAEMEYVLSCINEDKIPFDGDDFHEALRLGKEALAQPEQEPVAEIEFLDWVHPKLGVTKVEVEGGKPLILKAKIKFPTPEKCINCASLEGELERAKIKATVWKSAYDVERGYNEQDTTPPQRTWVGLTDEERGFCINANMGTGLWAMSKDVEAKLKEKNT